MGPQNGRTSRQHDAGISRIAASEQERPIGSIRRAAKGQHAESRTPVPHENARYARKDIAGETIRGPAHHTTRPSDFQMPAARAADPSSRSASPSVHFPGP